MINLQLAIISDLHVGKTARSQDFCPYEGICIDEQYLDKFCRFVEREKLKANYLLIPGDITGKAHPSEFKLASTIILEIASALSVPEEKILFVPGNHDKDWGVLPSGETDLSGVRNTQMYAPLRHNEWLFEKILNRSSSQMFTENCTAIWEFDDLIVVGYNSSWHDNRNQEIHHGLIKSSSLEWLDQKLQELDSNPLKVRVFLVHHHPIQYSNPIPDLPDFSIMTNAENLLKLLNKYKFDLLLHGHKHVPHLTTQSINSGFPLVILGAGSFSSQLEWSYNGHASNLFHLINIDARNSSSECISGLLQSWSYYSGQQWKPSTSHGGILHKIGFGSHTTHMALKKQLEPKIRLGFQSSNYVKWEDLVKEDRQLMYLPPDLVVALLKEIGNEINATYFGDGPENALLLLG